MVPRPTLLLLASELEGVRPQRPMTHDLLRSAIGSLGAEIVAVEITDLRENTFYARILLRAADGTVELDLFHPRVLREQVDRVEFDDERLEGRGDVLAGDGDQLGTLALDDGHDGDQFGALSRVGQGDEHVIAGHHADVAVAGFRRVQEESRGAGAGQRGGNLARDMAGFAQSTGT